MRTLRVEINGRPATAEQLHRPAVHNYGHFTSMQVRDGRVYGFASHLRRLAESSRELFGRPVEADRIRELLHGALRDLPSAVSVRVNVFSLTADPGEPVGPDVMVSVSSPSSEVSDDPWRVRTVRYERDLPHIKHVGGFGLHHQRVLAHAAGYDDPLFVDRRGRISEGAIWNVGFWDGESVIWPEAEMLPGVTMRVLASGLEESGVPSVRRPVTVEELPTFRAAFATYSICPGQPLAAIDDVVLPGDDRLPELLAEAWKVREPEAILPGRLP